MLNVFQIYHAVDSVRTNATKITDNFLSSIKNDHAYFQSLYFKGDKAAVLPNQGFIDEAPHVVHYGDLLAARAAFKLCCSIGRTISC
jgi:hypothetical protein